MAKTQSYAEQVNKNNILRLRELLNDLPKFVRQFFIGIDQNTASRTKLAYAFDLKIFFEYIKESNPQFKSTNINDFGIDILEKIQATDIEEFVQYIKLYTNSEGREISNDERGIKRKLSSLRALYNYFHKNNFIKENPVLQVNMPKLHEKAIIRLDPDEISLLLDKVESGDDLSERAKKFHAATKVRDVALLTLLLGTGIRVSECVGLDLTDIDFLNDRMKVTRKGGYESYVYFGEEVREALGNYFDEREEIDALPPDENALFLSLQKRRISVRAVEILVKKYSSLVTTTKKITPHKLRSSYGTALYQQTGDIYLVADVLGHKDINTTKKHYAALEDERRKQAKDIVKLRNKDE